MGDWRVGASQGQGTYGVVYRAFRVGHEDAGPVALKLAVYPWDPRFAREVELLSRLRHPGVPRLLGQGLWRHPSGVEHPYLVMEWVEGTPLYAWAQEHAPSSRQVLRLLAQLARALEAVHAAQAVHRDVKGDNILVRRSDGRALLLDFGSGHFQGAPRLTWQSLPPGTADYRSPEACLFLLRSVRVRDDYYPATPADDVFALGVTAYRLVMGEYPPAMEPYVDDAGAWHLRSADLGPVLARSPRVTPLRELILRMLSPSPEARGTARELAEALESAADGLPRPRVSVRAGRPWLVLAAAGVSALLLWTWPAAWIRPPSDFEVPDAGTAAVGDTAPLASVQPPSEKKTLAQELPPKPRPGQIRPDGKGRCPGSKQVFLNGGCWVEQAPMSAEACAENGYTYSKGRCYAPALIPPDKRLPTSSPADTR